LTTRTP